jgi:hypothetical protein
LLKFFPLLVAYFATTGGGVQVAQLRDVIVRYKLSNPQSPHANVLVTTALDAPPYKYKSVLLLAYFATTGYLLLNQAAIA